MATSLVTTKFKNFLADQILESLEEASNTSFYVYAGVHGDVIGDIPTPKDDTRQITIDAYRNMIFGKRVDPADVSLLIRYIPWEVNKVFAMYDDADENLLTKDFYCCVDEGSSIHVYKCLRNFFGSPSTVEPAFTYVEEVSNYTFETSDRYIWKYMYSVSSTVRDKFSTQTYFPVLTNTDVQNNAVKGALDVIRIEQNDIEIPGGGKKYDNYTSGTFTPSQLRVNGNNYIYAVSNSTISYDTGFYTGCLIYLSGGTGAGQYSKITDYFHNSNGNFIVISAPFAINPLNGTTWEIYPDVKIEGSGTQTVNAVARALVNATGSNSIFKIEILERGADYDYISATVVANSVITNDVAFVEAELHPIYSPKNGHGYDGPAELGAKAIEFSVKFANSEANTVLVDNRYQQIGILKDPSFANVGVALANIAGMFVSGEEVFKITPVRINSNVYISNTSTVITGESSTLLTASIVSSGTSGSYLPGDILDIEGGVATATAQLQVVKTNVRTATINAAGSGYTPGTFTANLNLGTAVVNAVFSVTANSLGQCESIIINNPGEYTTNPPYLANSTPVGGAGSGLTINITMGLEDISIFEPGSYAVIPTDLATNVPIANTSGEGAEVLLTFDSVLVADFLNQVSSGDFVYFTNPELTLQHLAVVNSVTNATHMEITVNGFFTCAMAYMYLPEITSSSEIVDIANATNIVISHVDQEIGTNDLLVGWSSGAKGQVDVITRAGEEKGFGTFVQLYKYNVVVLSNEFIENEIVYQGDSLANATATGLLHSVVSTGEATLLYTSNQVGQFDTATIIQGANSLAVASINQFWPPELEFASGDVLYIENLEPVNRASDQTETFQVIIGF